MKSKKVLIIISTVFLLRVIISCCDCVEPVEHKYSIEYISVYNLDNSGQNPIISETNIVPSKAYGIQIDFSLIQVAINQTNTFTIFPEASAFDCFCPPSLQYTAKDSIISLDITTINSFDSQHPSDSDVSNLFKVLYHNSYITLQNYIKQPQVVYLFEKPEKVTLSLFLLQPPEILGEHIFNIGITLSDHRFLTMTTNPVTLQ